ncbi:Fc.00g078060.m01.CDS01 [Cosmosporella sp. VM-42]
MADFKQLALEFVLADDEGQQTRLAQKAATEIQTAAANANPVARWVEAVQPWIRTQEAEDGDELPDWTSRAKALEFLSRTLDFLGDDVFKPSQIKLLVTFFGAMFEVDHKAGIMPSASALLRIVRMKGLQPSGGNDIIGNVCALGDDFARQVAKTRLAIYELLRLLMITPAIASDLQHRHGSSAGFMVDLLQLCRSERDPDCLMAWFDILKIFLVNFSPSKEVLEEVYGNFKQYFPIALPRASQTGVTPEELKLQLRMCFSATYQLADKALPFLLGKLDQGEGVTVNVKVDILKTIKACLDEYNHPEQSVVPYADQIWSSLKYEVRNGEIEDTIWGTLEVLKSLTMRLKGDNLRDFTLAVTRDCVVDLTNTTYTAPSGRLLVSVLSAKPSAFVLMVTPAITHIKENLRHPKAPMHSQDLLKVLHVILETRILLVSTEMSAEEREDFAAVDATFKTLYNDVYKSTVQLGFKTEASYDDIKVATQAVQGAGALVRQQPAKNLDLPEDEKKEGPQRLLPDGTCSEICEALFNILTHSATSSARSTGEDDLVNETTKALQKALLAYPGAFKPMVTLAIEALDSGCQQGGNSAATAVFTALASQLAFIGCSELSKTPSDGLSHFFYYVRILLSKLYAILDKKASPKIWCSVAAAIQSAVRYFNDACLARKPELGLSLGGTSWLANTRHTYPELSQLGGDVTTEGAPRSFKDFPLVAEIRNEFLIITSFVVRQLYRRATKVIFMHPKTSKPALTLSDDFTGADQASEYQYLHLISVLAGFIIHEMTESQQRLIKIESYAINLFRDENIVAPDPLSDEQKSSGFESSILENGSRWVWLALEKPNILSLGILQSLQPAAIARLFGNGIGQELLLSGCLAPQEAGDFSPRPVTLSMLTTLANKFNVETLDNLILTLEQHARTLLSQEGADSGNDENSRRLEQITSIYAIAAGILRRYAGKQAKGLIQLLREGPKDPKIGHHLARRLEMLVVPQQPLTKENYAIVKPLWMQKVYFELVNPMLQTAIGANSDVQDPLIKTNFSIAVLLMVKHMSFPIYEADADKILRVAIGLAQNIGAGPDVQAALDVLKNTIVEAPEKGQDHLRSITNICIASFSNNSSTKQERPEWLSADYASGANDAETQAGCGMIGLEIIGRLPKIFESRHLVPHSRRVERELTIACGHRVRDLRRSARLARQAWAEFR